MKRTLATLALLVATAQILPAQGELPAISVFPFGISRAASVVGGDLPGQSARRALEGVMATKKLAPKDRTSDPAITQLLKEATGLGQFASQAIAQDKGMQSKYALLGWVESAEVKAGDPDKNGKRNYTANLGVTIQINSVETGAMVASKLISVNNGLGAGSQQECKGFGLGRAKCEAAKLATLDDTQDKALLNATKKLNDAVMVFVNENVK